MDLENRVFRQSILNSIAASGADIDTTSLEGFVKLPGLKPIPADGIYEIVETAYAAEVRQLVTVTMPTIAASTVYGVQGGELQTIDQNNNVNRYKPFRTTSNAVLSGTALTDKVNVAWVIGWKIMQYARAKSIHVQAGPTATLTHASDAYTVGTILEGDTSGAKAVVAVVSSATVCIVIMLTSNDFTDTETLIENGVPIATTVTSNVYTGNLGILDDAGYNSAMGTRKGPSSWISDNTNTIAASSVAITTAGVESFGDGARMLQDVPTLESRSPNLASGQWNFATNDLPNSTSHYNRFAIKYYEKTNPDSRSNSVGTRQLCQAIWLDVDATNYSDLRTDLLALA